MITPFIRRVAAFALVLVLADRSSAVGLTALFDERVKSVVAVEFFTENELDRRPSTTAAFVADNEGTIILPFSAINNYTPPSKLKDFRVYLPGHPVAEYSRAEYLGQDSVSGWHFVRVEEALRSKLKPITAFAGESTEAVPKIGEEYWGIGLRGKDEDFKPYFMSGRISHLHSLPEQAAVTLAEVAAPGLPVFDAKGGFAGIAVGGFGQNFYSYSRNDRGTLVMLVKPDESGVFQLASEIQNWIKRVPSNVVGRPIAWLGVYGLQPVDPEVAAFLKLDQQSGCVVSEVLEGSPAQSSGMQNRDIILEIDGSPLPRIKPDRMGVNFFEREILYRKPGDTMKLTVLRGTERIELSPVLIEQPKFIREADRQFFDRLGFTAREFVYGDGVVRRVKLADQKGVIASFVKNSSPVATAGLRNDDWILEVDGVEVKSYQEAIDKLAAVEADTARPEFVLLTSRNGETAVLRVKLK